MYDVLIEGMLGALFDVIEDRYGRVVALLVSFAVALLIIAALVAVLAYIF